MHVEQPPEVEHFQSAAAPAAQGMSGAEKPVTQAQRMPPTSGTHSVLRIVAIILALLVLAVCGFIGYRRWAISAGKTPSTRLVAKPTSASSLKSRIAFVSERDGNAEIYTMRPDGSDLRRLTDNSAADTEPAWSPDGKGIAFVSDRDGQPEIYRMDRDGQNQRRLTHSTGFSVGPAWSSGGLRIGFHSDRDGNVEIYQMYADTLRPMRLTHNLNVDAYLAWSPDGQQIAYHIEDDGNWDIYVMDVDGSHAQRLTSDPDRDWLPAWASFPDVSGNVIIFWGKRNSEWRLYAYRFDTQAAEAISRAIDVGEGCSRPALSSDYRNLVFHMKEGDHTEIFSVSFTSYADLVKVLTSGKWKQRTVSPADNYDAAWWGAP
jgi:TolB protein